MADTPSTPPPASEDQLIAQRRALAGLDGVDDDGARYGLALSGGGLRSSTFCFGLLRGLARQKMLTRFDYLSTVSGGGYIGSALGRLYQPDTTAGQVQQRLDQDDTLLLWWLRSNGRYLTPAGLRDRGQAAASMLRNILFSQFELAVLLLLCAATILLPYVLMGVAGMQAGSLWWWLLALPLFAGTHSIFRYWLCRPWPNFQTQLANLGGALLTGGLAAWLGNHLLATWQAVYANGASALLALQTLGVLLLFAPFTAALLSLRPPAADDLAAQRLLHTKRLGAALWWFAALAFVGLLDWAATQLLVWLADTSAPHAKSLGGWAVTIALLRASLPTLQRWIATCPAKPLKTQTLLNAVGLLLLLLLALAWLTALRALLQAQGFWATWPVLAATLVYAWLTRADIDVLNLSSLHNFYRARIERAYVSVGNYAAGGQATEKTRFPDGSPLRTATHAATERVASLTESVDGDDIALADYQPHAHGGPIHLMGCCINQSVDDRTGNYNADRLGIALAVSALGAETGTGMPTPLSQLPAVGTLSRWVAISGAAAGSGMGSQTSPGLAALMFMSGLRLGYWTPNLLPPPDPAAKPPVPYFATRLPKSALLLAECLARFPGLRSNAWYVSDGGHFDNTGVYALLKRRLEVIVLADCGADPLYGFGDLENLTRKAEIDFGASIAFVDPASLVARTAEEATLFALVGSVHSIKAATGPQCLLLARILYDGGAPPGLLVVVKPRLLDALPLEIAGYAARNASFPQQPTSDQFFDEAQWEAYHQLGLRQGQLLTAQALAIFRDRLGGDRNNTNEDDTQTA